MAAGFPSRASLDLLTKQSSKPRNRLMYGDTANTSGGTQLGPSGSGSTGGFVWP